MEGDQARDGERTSDGCLFSLDGPFLSEKKKILDKTKQEMGGELQNGDSSRLTGLSVRKET